MLASSKIIGFVPTKDSVKARGFYEGILQFEFVSEITLLDRVFMRKAIIPINAEHYFFIVGNDLNSLHTGKGHVAC